MKLVYGVQDKPSWGKTIVFALQQLLAIMAATIAVPMIINNNFPALAEQNMAMSTTAALFGAGVGTLVYLLFTKFRSPVFLGSSFAFLSSMIAAFSGATASYTLGYVGLILGAVFAGLVYVIIAIIIKFAGVKWLNKLMPAVVIGPTVAIIGLSLAGNAVGDLVGAIKDGNGNFIMTAHAGACMVSGLVTLAVTIICSVYGKKMLKMIPFIIGILAGYAVAAIFTGIGAATGNEELKIINFSLFNDAFSKWYPDFSFLNAFKGFGELDGAYVGTIAVAYVPVAFVVFAEHIADHKNLSTIIEHDLLEDPGLHRTLLGDGVGSMAGAFFGGCPNTTYGESVGCVAISGNASVRTIFTTAIMAIVIAFISPFATFLATIPSCVMGGVCIALYGFIAVSGLMMIQEVDLGDNKNLFVVCVILIAGVGGMSLKFGQVTITKVACALILGILVNLLVNIGGKKKENTETAATAKATVAADKPEEENK